MRSIGGGAMGMAAVLLLAACGSTSQGGSPPAAELMVVPQNTAYTVGVNRVSVALLDRDQRPVTAATATTFEVQGARGAIETGPLEDIAAQYGSIPVYVGAARFSMAGNYRLVVHATESGGMGASGSAVITVADRPPEIPIGGRVPPVRQPIATDSGVKISDIDSGVPPDAWHTVTIADGLTQHRPMVLYFGEPGFCKSRTCGPTVQILEQLCTQYCDRFLFEHIEDHYPAGPDEVSAGGKTVETPFQAAFAAFGLQSEPWVYFVNAQGVVADRFEGPVTLSQLRSAADGTLAGRVPAVDVAVAP